LARVRLTTARVAVGRARECDSRVSVTPARVKRDAGA
jgi:hypothetical protein